MDREKVVKHFEHLLNAAKGNYQDFVDLTVDAGEEILALLKEKETKLICNLLGGQPYEVYCRECRTILCVLGKGETMNDLKSIFNYCPHCGRSVKWE